MKTIFYVILAIAFILLFIFVIIPFMFYIADQLGGALGDVNIGGKIPKV